MAQKWIPGEFVRIEIASYFNVFKDLSKDTQFETLMFTRRISDILIIFLFYGTIIQSLFLQISDTSFKLFEFFLETGTSEYFLRKINTYASISL